MDSGEIAEGEEFGDGEVVAISKLYTKYQLQYNITKFSNYQRKKKSRKSLAIHDNFTRFPLLLCKNEIHNDPYQI